MLVTFMLIGNSPNWLSRLIGINKNAASKTPHIIEMGEPFLCPRSPVDIRGVAEKQSIAITGFGDTTNKYENTNPVVIAKAYCNSCCKLFLSIRSRNVKSTAAAANNMKKGTIDEERKLNPATINISSIVSEPVRLMRCILASCSFLYLFFEVKERKFKRLLATFMPCWFKIFQITIINL